MYFYDDSRKRRAKEGAGQVGEIIFNIGFAVLVLIVVAGLCLGAMEF